MVFLMEQQEESKEQNWGVAIAALALGLIRELKFQIFFFFFSGSREKERCYTRMREYESGGS